MMEQEQNRALDKAVDLLQEFAGKVGETAEELWPHAVTHFRWDAISNMVNGIIISSILFIGSALLFKQINKEKDISDSDKGFFKTTGTICAMVGIIALTACIGLNLADAVEPVGGLLRKILQ